MICAETEYTIIVRPEWFDRAIQTFGYNSTDYNTVMPAEISTRVQRQMLVEHASCGYVQLMPSEELIQQKFGFSEFLTRHTQIVEGGYIDLINEYGNNDAISSNRRYIVIDNKGDIVTSGDEYSEDDELRSWMTNNCISYNCNSNPSPEADVDADGISNADITELDIDGDGIDDTDHERETDTDGDGIPNARDLDIDCDDLINLYDDDMDGDGVLNVQDNDIDGDYG